MSHNKTLAAQLYEEFKELFPHNAVEYFVSYYDYYQPEAYIPQRDIYIEKDASRNDDLDRLRLAATSSVVSRRDVVIVAQRVVHLRARLAGRVQGQRRAGAGGRGDRAGRAAAASSCGCNTNAQRHRVEAATFRVRGDVVEMFPADEEHAIRIELFGDEVERVAHTIR